jgi:hypothetical protein
VRNGALGVLALVVLAGALAHAADAQVNTIKKVSVKGGTVEILGTQKPSFTTFPMSDPPRFVIDISEAVFSGVPEDVPISGSGRITAIKTASYGNDASAIARVVIGFDRDVEPDVQASGNTLVVKVGAGSAPAVASRATPAPAATPTTAAASPDTALAQGRALAAAATASQAKADDQAARDALARANAKAEADRKAAEAAALAEQQRQAELARQREAIAKAETDRKAKEQAEKDARARAEQERAAQQKAMAEAQARADADRKAQEEATRAAAVRAEADRKARDEAAKVAAATAAAQQKAQEDAARAEAQRRAQEEAARAESQRRAQEEAARAEAERRSRAEASRTVVAQAETPKAAAREVSDARPVPSGGGAEVSGRRKTVTLVGFSPDKSRVFVRTNEPVRYTVSQADDRTVVLELENTAFQRKNDRRALDTHFFGGPVVQISPSPAGGKTVRVAVTLRDKVGYQARQDGNEVSLQFAP